MRRVQRARRPISPKPDTCTEAVDIYAAGISVKSLALPREVYHFAFGQERREMFR